MKRIIIALLAVMLMLTACTKLTDTEDERDVDTSIAVQQEIPDSEPIGEEVQSSGIELSIATPAGSLAYQELISDGNLVYAMVRDTGAASHIAIYDSESKTKALWPGSGTDDVGGASMIQSQLYGANIMYADGVLYYWEFGAPLAPDENAETSQDKWFTVVKRDLNNMDSMAISKSVSPEYLVLSDSKVATDGEELYVTAVVREEDSEYYNRAVILRIGFDENPVEEMCTIAVEEENTPYPLIVDAFGDTIILLYRHDPQELVQLLRYEMEAEEVTELMSWTSNEVSGFFYEGAYYYHELGTTAIMKLALDSETTEVFIEGINDENQFETLGFYSVFDDRVVFQYGSQEQYINEYGYIDLNTGAIVELSLFVGDSGDPSFAQILAETDTHYFVYAGNQQVPIVDKDSEGGDFESVLVVRQYLAIAKEDYWASQPNFIEFEDLVKIQWSQSE